VRIRFRVNTLTLLFVLIIPGASAFGGHGDGRSASGNLRQRLGSLEAGAVKGERAGFAGEVGGVGFAVSGVVDLEGFAQRSDSEGNSSGLDYSVEAALEAEVNEYLSGEIVLTHDEGDPHIVNVDEALLSIEVKDIVSSFTFALDAGKLYLPFGKFESAFVSDPFTADLGETRNTAVVVGLESELLTADAGVFGGDRDEEGARSGVESLAVTLELNIGEGGSVGTTYLSDLAESDADLVTDSARYETSVPAFGIFVEWEAGPFTLTGEYLTALRGFGEGVVEASKDLTGVRPSAWSGEISYAGKRWVGAVRLEGARDYLDDPTRFGAALSFGLVENVLVGVEYLRTEVDDESVDTVTVQFALEF